MEMEMKLRDLFDQSEAQDQYKADYNAHPTSGIIFADSGDMLVTDNGLFANGVTALTPTDWAWRQIFSKLGGSVFGKGANKTLPADYLLALRPDLRGYVLNDHCKHYPNGNWFIRANKTDCRAVLSDRYAAIGNTELLGLLDKITTETTAEVKLVQSSSVTPDSLNVRLTFKDIQRGNGGGWGIGIAITNGEIGQRKLCGLPLLQRHSCTNSIVIDKQAMGFEFTHMGSATSKRVAMKAGMMEILPFAAKLLDDMIKADEQVIPDFTEVLQGLSLQYGWDEKTRMEVAVGTEGWETKAAIVNGVTHAAKIFEGDARMDMEILGGRILCAPDSLFAQAAKIAYQNR